MMTNDIERNPPGILFTYNEMKYIRLACSNYVMIHKPILHCQSVHELEFFWKYHSNQSLTAHLFFPFRAYSIAYAPYHLERDIIKECDECGKLNLILNSMHSYQIELFLKKEPIYIKQHEYFNDIKFHSRHMKIQKSFNVLFIGYIKKIERNNNINIPVVILGVIKDYIQVGPAIFYCKGFKNPLYGTEIYDDYQNDDFIYDSA